MTEAAASPKGLRIDRVFSKEGVHPFDEVKWAKRTATIKDDRGNVVFEQRDCEFPEDWSPLAVNVVASKYFHGDISKGTDPGKGGRESSVHQLVGRVASTIAEWGRSRGYFATKEDADRFYSELAWLCVNQHGAFNSPVWFNVGFDKYYGLKGSANNWRWDDEKGEAVPCEDSYKYPQSSACFIQGVGDDTQSIMDLAASEAMLFKYGSGTGTDLSTLRSTREKLSGGGTPSGPVSFMRVYDAIAGVIKSGGRVRRAAKMQTLKCWHPDIVEFIECKQKEEEKARALIRQGYDSNFNGEAYSSVCFQNANLSVRVTDEFLKAAEEGRSWTTRAVTTGEPVEILDASTILDKIAEGTWLCGDPGVQYEDTIQKWHTCPNTAPINSSNPCAEYMSLDNSACNLASLNLMKFRRDDGTFDVDRFRAACRIFIIAQDIIVDSGSYPTKKIAETAHKFRQLGLGYGNLGSLLMASGLPYDSDEGRALAAAVTAIMHGEAYLTSAEMAEQIGSFDGFAENRLPMSKVIDMHREAAYAIDGECPAYLADAAERLWDDVQIAGLAHGYRNSQATVLAPCGTISFLMDCSTTGIEPDIALVKYKNLAGGGVLKIVNQTVGLALGTLGYAPPTIVGILEHIEENGTIEGAAGLSDRHLPVFDCAFPVTEGGRCISWEGHLRIMASVQPFLSGSISKTINMPKEATVADIREAYLLGWKLGLKAVAIYRDGSKESQPVSTSSVTNTTSNEPSPAQEIRDVPCPPRRERLPETRTSVTHKFDIQGHEGYLTVGFFPDGRPGELFVTMAKEGSTVGGLMDAIGTLVSMGLQYGVPLEVLVEKFAHTRFDPSGMTRNRDIPFAKSLTDYVFRWMGIQFVPGCREANVPKREEPESEAEPSGGFPGLGLKDMNGITAMRAIASFPDSGLLGRFSSDAPPCPDCGSITVRNGSCHVCPNCGSTTGCS